MLTKIAIRNFKKFEDIEFELGKRVVLIGPNNSGKTTALQALALWDLGLRKWSEKRKGNKGAPEKRPGVTINRKDLISLPTPNSKLLWKDLHVRTQIFDEIRKTQNVRIGILIHGI